MQRISVLMPAYNCEKYIAASINSILDQTFTEFELIIVDDGSTDNTHNVISAFTDERIRYFRNEHNKGLAFTRNWLLQLANCQYLAFLDSDDMADKGRLEKEYAVLSAGNEISLVSSSVRSLDEKGKLDHKGWKFDLSPEALKVHLLFYNPIVTSATMFKKEMLPEEKFRNGYPPCEDYDLWVRSLLHHKGMVLPEFLATYRLYHNSVSKRKAEDARINRNKVIMDQLGYYFKNEFSDNERTLHLSLVEFSLKDKLKDLAYLRNWIHKLILLNQKYRHFEESILKQQLYERILKKLLRLEDYDFSVYRTLRQMKKELQPDITFEHRKKELAILAFSLAKKKFIHV